MVSDDRPSAKKPDRKHLLDEIRRRAEEAELKRIEEEEERKQTLEEPEEQRLSSSDREPDESLTTPPPIPKQALQEQRCNIVRERLLIALDRGKADKASALLEELAELDPDEPGLETFRARVEALDDEKKRARERARTAESHRKAEVQEEHARKEAQRKRVAELIEQANSFYQQEKYERGLQALDEAGALDNESDAVRQLREQIERAKELADQIKQEEAKRKADESASVALHPPPPEPAIQPARDGDFWGSARITQRDELGYDLPPEEKGPVGPPRPPLTYRLIDRLSKLKIAVKPIVTGVVVILIVISAYVIVDHIRNAVSPPRYCLLLFPATSLPGDNSVGYTTTGLTDDLARDFAEIGALRVVSPATGATLAELGGSPAQSARTVGANFFLRWAVGRTGDAVTLQTSLFDTVSSKAIWTTQYKISMRELPSLRHELVRKLARAMNLSLSEEEESSLKSIPTSNPSAYDSYLQGRMMLTQQDEYPLDGAMHMFELAVQADSTFTDALSALGWTHVLSYETESVPRQSHISWALNCCQRALARDPHNAEAYRVLGMVQEFRGQYEQATESFEESVDIAPSDPESQRRLAIALAARGMTDDALKSAQRAVTVAPGDFDSYRVLGLIQQFKAEYNEAFHSYEQALRLAKDQSEFGSGIYADVFVYIQQPDRSVEILMDRVARFRQSYVDYYRLGRVEQSAGRPKADWQSAFLRSKELIEARLQDNPQDAYALTYLALVQTRLGEFRSAVSASNNALRIASNDVDVLLNTARMYALQRDKTQALEYLSKYLRYRFSLRAILDMDFYNLRQDQDFISTVTM